MSSTLPAVWLQTDPDTAENSADISWICSSPEDHRDIVSFATEATELVPMRQVGDTANKQTIKNTLVSITEVNGNTNYRAFAEKLRSNSAAIADPTVRKVILFLTDGVPEPDYTSGGYDFHDDIHGLCLANSRPFGAKRVSLSIRSVSVRSTRAFCSASPRTQEEEAKFLGSAGDIAVNFVESCVR